MGNVPQPETTAADTAAAWSHVLPLSCQLTVALAVVGFKARDVLGMGLQTVISVDCRVGSDVPLLVNGELIARGELEVAGDRLVLRLTELA